MQTINLEKTLYRVYICLWIISCDWNKLLSDKTGRKKKGKFYYEWILYTRFNLLLKYYLSFKMAAYCNFIFFICLQRFTRVHNQNDNQIIMYSISWHKGCHMTVVWLFQCKIAASDFSVICNSSLYETYWLYSDLFTSSLLVTRR